MATGRVQRARLTTAPPARGRVVRARLTTMATGTGRVLRARLTTSVTLTANAGLAQAVNSRDTVQLSGRTSGGSPTVFTWTQTAGPAVTLRPSASASDPSFLAPATDAGTTLTFTLTVGDGTTTSSPATVNVAVAPHIEWVYGPSGWLSVLTDSTPTVP